MGHERIALAFPIGNPWIERFNDRIDRILEAGLIKHWKQYFWPSDDECALGGGTEMNVVRVYINDMQGAFYVLLLGCVIGVILIIIELGLGKLTSAKEESVVEPF